MKKALLILTLLLLTQDAWAINKFKRAGAHNWTDDAGWSTTSGGANDTVAPTASDDVFLDANSGNVTISAASVGKSLNCTGYTGTLTHNAFNLSISGSVTLVSGMTYTPASASSSLTIAATGTLTTGGKLLWSTIQQGAAVVTLGDNLSYVAQKTASHLMSSGSLVLNGFTMSGNSATNRLLIRTNTLGTPLTITNTTGTFANADFRDITFSSAADYSAITGLSGDCGGNTNGTFTTAATQTYTGGTGSWSDVTKWTSRVPLPQDNVLMSGVTGGTITADMPRLGKSIDWTGASGSPTWADTVANTLYGSLTLISGMTFSLNDGTTYEGRGSFTLTSAGKSLGTTTIAMVGGTLTLQDAMATSGTNAVTHSNGSIVTNGFSVSVGGNFNSTNTNTRALDMTNSTVTVGGTSGSPWNFGTSTNMTLTSTGSTIVMSDTGASSKTFAGGGLTYNNLLLSGGAGAVIITGSNSFLDILMNPSVAGTKSLQLTSGTTTTIRNGSQGFGNGTNLWTLTETGGTDPIISKSSGTFRGDYLSLTAIDASATGKFYAGPLTHSTDGGGNDNWIFTLAPGGTGFADSGSIDDEEQDVYIA